MRSDDFGLSEVCAIDSTAVWDAHRSDDLGGDSVGTSPRSGPPVLWALAGELGACHMPSGDARRLGSTRTEREMVPRYWLHSSAAKCTVGCSYLKRTFEIDKTTKGQDMKATINTIEASDNLFVLGESLRPLLTNAMGSSVEIFDTSGPAEAGPPPHFHPWEEAYVVISGELEVIVDGESYHLRPGGVAHVPAGVTHGYRNITDAHFLTIVTKGNAAKFFSEVSRDVEMTPPDIAGVVRVASSHGIEFVL